MCVERAAAGRVERREIAERLRELERAERKRFARDGEVRHGGVAETSTNTPVFGPPLCSWPVECRYRGP